MKRILLIVCALCTLGIIACHRQAPVDHDALLGQIQNYEKQLQMISLDQNQADSIVGLYKKFVDNFPEDSLCPGFLMKAGEITTNVGQPDSAIQYFDRIIENYPDCAELPECYFYKAYSYERAEKYPEAIEAYTYFADTYPDHVLASGLKETIIPNLGKMEQLTEQYLNNPKNKEVPVEEI